MNWLGLIIIALGIVNLISTLIFKDKYSPYLRAIKVVRGKEENFYKLQLYASILIFFIFTSIGAITLIYDLESPYLILTPLIIHIVYYLMKRIGRIKGYL